MAGKEEGDKNRSKQQDQWIENKNMVDINQNVSIITSDINIPNKRQIIRVIQKQDSTI